jgi:hypothetical protein
MTKPNLAPDPAPSKPTVFLRKAEVKRRLGEVSDETIARLEEDDPRFPKSTIWRKQKIWPEEAIERYVQHVLAHGEPTPYPVGYQALVRANAARDLEPPRRGWPPGSKNKRKEVEAAVGDG